MRRCFGLIALGILLAGCEESTGIETVDAVQITSAASVVGYQDSVDLSAQLMDDDGDPVSGIITWSSSKPGIADVSADGTVAGLWPGVAVIYAQSGALKDSVRLVVHTASCTPGIGIKWVEFDGHGFEWTRIHPGFTDGSETATAFPTEMLIGTGIVYGTDATDLMILRNSLGGRLSGRGPCTVPGSEGMHTVALIQPSHLDAPAPLPALTVIQEQFAYADPGNNDYLLFRYTFTNDGPVAVNGVRFGVVADFDVSDPASTDVGSFDVATGVADVVAQDSAGHPRMGGSFLIGAAPVSYTAAFPAAAPQRTGSEWYGYLSGGIGLAKTGVEDVRQLLAASPFQLAPGESVVRWYGVAAGDNRADFNANVAAARAKAATLD